MTMVARFIWIAVVWALLSLVAGLAAFTAVPSLLGHRTMTVLSGSMTPTLDVGGVVVDEVIAPTDARVGDVVTFPDPNRRDRQITHRLQRITVKDGKAYMVTKGDANRTVERWNVPLEDEIGRVAYHLPKLGYARAWLSSRAGRLGALGALVLLLALVIVEIWRPSRTPPQGSLSGRAAK